MKNDTLVGCLGLLFMLIGMGMIIYGFVALVTYAIFWCFGYADGWNLFIPLGLLLLAGLLKLLCGKENK